MEKYIPFAYATSIFEISPEFYLSNSFKYILVDLDNTLDSFKAKLPTERTIQLVNNLKDHGIELIIISNNNETRVKTYSDALQVRYLSKSQKPFFKKIDKFLTNSNIDKQNCCFIGDQLMTDIKTGEKLGIKTILTEEIVKENQLVTKINKIFDKIKRARLKKKNLLIDWREKYGRNN